MRRRFLMVMLGLGALFGFGSGFAHLAHARWAAQHGGYGGECSGWGHGYGYNDGYQQQQAAPPVVQQQPVEKPAQVQPQVIIVQQPAPVVQQQPAAQTPVIVVQPQAVPQQVVIPNLQPQPQQQPAPSEGR